MDYYCDVCDKHIKPRSKYKHFKSKCLEEFYRCKHILFSLKDIDINDVDEAICLNIVEHNKTFDYYPVKCHFKLVFIDYQFCANVTSKSSDNKTMIFWSNFLEKINRDFKDKGYTFNHIAEMHIRTIAIKVDFYIKHNMCALE